ncbi:MAG: alcohol dehydrogenase, partial [Candidatus Thermoplasmatota archaeon]|nr:alcohol dehydrogenase [Candidatus Thermoplasmatota archaeon]
MKALLVGPKFGNENVTVSDVKNPPDEKGSIRVKLTLAGMNPLDYNLINGKILYNLQPVPHIPGSEAIGTAMDDGV